MSFYEGIKDALKIAQQMDNVTLIKQLLDLGEQALDMQEEIRKLKEENSELRKEKDIKDKIEYHVDPYLTLKNDTKDIKYCVACWANGRKLVTMQRIDNRKCFCPLCKTTVHAVND